MIENRFIYFIYFRKLEDINRKKKLYFLKLIKIFLCSEKKN